MQAQVHSASPQMIPMEAIIVQDEHNPRKHFNESDFNRLVVSIRDNGLITPISVRRKGDDQYYLVAGERRFRALKTLRETEVPALVLDCDDDTARRLALLENTDRADLSIPEEALAAQRHVDAFDGDHAAAAASIGWSLSKLKSRLALLHCSPAVLDALTVKAIALGHAELLSGLPTNQQDVILQRVIDGSVPVSVLKEQLEAFSISLSQAFFDTAGCLNCPHNSSQAELFADKISSNRCSNKACFTDKTKAALQKHKDSLADDYASLAFKTEKVEDSCIPLVATGKHGVGESQLASGCAGCAFRGALIEDRIGPSTGMVSGPLCFQRTCHAEKVREYQQSIAPTVIPSVTHSGAQTATSPTKPKQVQAQSNKTPNAVAIQYDAVIRRAVQANIGKSPHWILAMAVYAQVTLLGTGNSELEGHLNRLGLKVKPGYNKAETIALLAKCDIAVLKQALVSIPSILLAQDPDNQSMFQNLSRRELNARIAKAEDFDLKAHVRVDSEYLSAFTKAGIEAELVASGFKAFIEAQTDGKKRYAEILAKKKDELVKAVLSAGFDFGGYLPDAIIKQMKDSIPGKK